MSEKPAFIQGLYSFEGRGLASPVPPAPAITYVAPFAKRAQLIYFRAGNSSDELIYVVLMRRGQPLRYFPIGAKASVHVPLAVVEDLGPETKIEALIGAPEGMKGSVLLDIGFLEIA